VIDKRRLIGCGLADCPSCKRDPRRVARDILNIRRRKESMEISGLSIRLVYSSLCRLWLTPYFGIVGGSKFHKSTSIECQTKLHMLTRLQAHFSQTIEARSGATYSYSPPPLALLLSPPQAGPGRSLLTQQWGSAGHRLPPPPEDCRRCWQ
jgi:hypothetical protein